MDLFSSDEEIANSGVASVPDITIEDSEGEPIDGSIIVPIRRKKNRARVLSTDSEDEDVEERYALSPRTRKSLTGKYHRRPSDDEGSSEIDYSDTDQNRSRHGLGKSYGKSDASNVEFEERSKRQNRSHQGTGINEKDVSLDSLTSKNKSAVQELENLPNEENAQIEPRYTHLFKDGLKEVLSSTICEMSDTADLVNLSESSDDIQSISTNQNTIEISSDDQSEVIDNPQKNISASDELMQPTITKAFSNMPPPAPRSTKMTPKKSAITYVSSEFYEKEVQKLTELKADLIYAQKLADKLGRNLPDSGKQMRSRCDLLCNDIAIKSKYISTLQVENVAEIQKATQQKKPFRETSNWDDLSNAVNQVQPIHTGRMGLATFNAQKALTVERLKDLHGSLESCPAEQELADDPEGLKINLMVHQKHALKWMMWREMQKPRGGILADDMGLGKTLSMIALVLASKNQRGNNKNGSNSESDSDDVDNGNGNEWTTKGRRNYYNGGTLVICPASLVRQWEFEVNQRVLRNRLNVCVHHGNSRDAKPKHLRTYDMVVTTYNIVSREQKTEGALFGLKWSRIILDEAHVIRNHKTQMSMAVCNLRSKYRWALTGTPVQNKEMDIYSLLKFLRCTPFNDLQHWKRWIDSKGVGGQERLNTVMKTIMLRRTKAVLVDRGELNCLPSKCTELIDVILDKDEMNVYQKVMIYSRTLFAQFLFQRAERNSEFMYTQDANRPTFLQTKDPNGAYYQLHQKFTKMHQGNREVKSTDILVLLLRLRQVCCHPGLIDSMLEDDDAENISSENNSTQPEIDLLEQLNKLAIKDTPNDNNGNSSDSIELPEDHVMARASARVMQRSNPVFDIQRPSSKVLKILEVLKKHVLCTNDKAIVVSQWSGVLNIIKMHLAKENIAALQLDGSVNVKIRQDIVEQFNNARNSTKILLLSLTAGGVGLNLIGANHLLLTDIHWNPQLESQAQDRIYRVGQKKDVIVYKLMCKDTIEERIRSLQEHKLSIASNVLDGVKNNKGSKLTIDDLKGLFDM